MDHTKPTEIEYITSFEDLSNKPKTKLLKKRTLAESHQPNPESIVGPDVKKKPKVDYDEIILDNLPKAELYERSLMHRDIINHSNILLLTQIIPYKSNPYITIKSPLINNKTNKSFKISGKLSS